MPIETQVAELTEGIRLLVRRVRAAAAGQGLSLTEAAVLGRLEQFGPATTADLARAEAVKPQSMGTTIATLEEMGLVERKAHPTDGRQMLIELSAKGRELRQTTRTAKQTWLVEAIAKLDGEEREALFAASKILKRLAEQ